MALADLSKEQRATRLVIGVALAIAGYFVFKKVVLNKIVSQSSGSNKNFLNADGNNEGVFVAKQYDKSHKNEDGTQGATWISYNNSDIIGYWQSGVIKQGTIINSLV